MKRTTALALAVLLILTSIGLAAPKEMNLHVSEPGESTEWTLGTTNSIKWSFRGELGSISIRLQRVGWVNAQMILSDTVPLGDNRTGVFKWNIPADLPPGGKYTVSVKAENGIWDTSGEFTLVAGKGPLTQISLETPLKGGERWNPGTTTSIRWTYGGNPGPTVKLALIKKEEGSVIGIASAVSVGADGKGRYEWKIPDLKPGKDYYVGIASNSNAFYQDMSKVPVTITVIQ